MTAHLGKSAFNVWCQTWVSPGDSRVESINQTTCYVCLEIVAKLGDEACQRIVQLETQAAAAIV